MAKSTVALPDEDPRVNAMRLLLDTDGSQATVHAEADVRVRSFEIIEMRERDTVFPAPAFLIKGEVERFHGDFPNGVTEISYPQPKVTGADSKRLISCMLPTISFLHRLTPNEQVTLCEKGLMLPGFEVPKVLSENTYQMPVDLTIRTLDTDKGPITSVSIDHRDLVETSAAEDGYALVDYFPLPEVDGDALIRDESVRDNQVALEDMGGDVMTFDDVERPDHDLDGAAKDDAEKAPAPVEPAPEEGVEDDVALAADVFGDAGDEERDSDFVSSIFRKFVTNPDREAASAKSGDRGDDADARAAVAAAAATDAATAPETGPVVQTRAQDVPATDAEKEETLEADDGIDDGQDLLDALDLDEFEDDSDRRRQVATTVQREATLDEAQPEPGL